MMMQLLIYALVPTILIELAVLLFLRERRRRVLAASVVINILTNVLLNLYVNCINGSLPVIICGEVLVVLIEALWYYLFIRNLRQSFVYSFLCNAISFLLGLLAELLYLFSLSI